MSDLYQYLFNRYPDDFIVSDTPHGYYVDDNNCLMPLASTSCPAPNPTLEGGATSHPDEWLPIPNLDCPDYGYQQDDYQFVQTDSRFRPPSDNELF